MDKPLSPLLRHASPFSKQRLSWLARSVEGLALVAFTATFFVVPHGVTSGILIANLAVFYILFLRALMNPERILPWLPTYMTIEVLFFAFSFIIFYYPYQLYLIGATDLGVSRFVSNSFVDGSNQAITLCTVGMIAFSMGYRVIPRSTPWTHRAAVPSTNREIFPDCPSRYFLAMATVSSFLLVVLSSVYTLFGWRSAGEGRYTGTTTEALGVEGLATAILMLCLIVGALWVYARAAHFPAPPGLVIGLVVATAWTLRLLLLGDRGAFLLFGLVVAGGYFTFVRRASVVLLAGGLAVWLIIYDFIEVLRSTPNWYSSANFMELFTQAANSEESSESSFNVITMTVRASVESVPSDHSFMYGLFKLIQFATIVPFSGRFYLPYIDPEYMHSAEMLGDIMLGGRATWNTGTNVVSDAYVDLGVAGVVGILFLIGLIAKIVCNYVAAQPADPHRVVIYLLTMALFAELPRYAVDVPARTLAWGLVLGGVVRLFIRKTTRADIGVADNGHANTKSAQHAGLSPRDNAAT